MSPKIITTPYLPEYDGEVVIMEAVDFEESTGRWGNKLRIDFKGCHEPLYDTRLSRFYNFPDELGNGHDVVKESLIASGGELPEDGELSPRVFMHKMYEVELRTVHEKRGIPYTVVARILKRRQ